MQMYASVTGTRIQSIRLKQSGICNNITGCHLFMDVYSIIPVSGLRLPQLSQK